MTLLLILETAALAVVFPPGGAQVSLYGRADCFSPHAILMDFNVKRLD
jgi:hypothetical protein